MKVQVLAVLAGISFGLYPLLANRSQMQGNPLSLSLLIMAIILCAPFAFKQGIHLPNQTGLLFLVSAGVLFGLGMLFFTGMLSKASTTQVASLFILMTVVQIAIPVVWQVVSGNADLKQLGGIAAAGLAVYLLS
jgi:drug/metabolite transporter (DMT)-like permease